MKDNRSVSAGLLVFTKRVKMNKCCVCRYPASHYIGIGNDLFYFCPVHSNIKAKPIDDYRNRFKPTELSAKNFLKYMSKTTVFIETDGSQIQKRWWQLSTTDDKTQEKIEFLFDIIGMPNSGFASTVAWWYKRGTDAGYYGKHNLDKLLSLAVENGLVRKLGEE